MDDYGDQDEVKANFEAVSTTLTTTNTSMTHTPTPVRSIISLASVPPVTSCSGDGSVRSSASKGSNTSLQRRKTVSGSFSRKNRKPKEMTWLRDTLSLGSSTQSGRRVGMESDEDEAASGSDAEFGGGSDAGSGRSSALNLGAAAASNSESCCKNPSPFSSHDMMKSSPACLACMRGGINCEPDLPVPAEAPPPPLPPPDLQPSERPIPTARIDTESRVSTVKPIVKDKSQEKGNEWRDAQAPIKWIRATIHQAEGLALPPRNSGKSYAGQSSVAQDPSKGIMERLSDDRWGVGVKNNAPVRRDQLIPTHRDIQDIGVPLTRSRSTPVGTGDRSAPQRTTPGGDGIPYRPPLSPREPSRARQPVLARSEESLLEPARRNLPMIPASESSDFPRMGRGADLSRRPSPRSRENSTPPFEDSLGQQYWPECDRSPPRRRFERIIRPSPPQPRPCTPPLSPLVDAARVAPYHHSMRRREVPSELSPLRWIPPRDRSPLRWSQPRDRSPVGRTTPPRCRTPPRRDASFNRSHFRPDAQDLSPYGRDYDATIMRHFLRQVPYPIPLPEAERNEFDRNRPSGRRLDERARLGPATEWDEFRHTRQEPNFSHSILPRSSEVYVRRRHPDVSPNRGFAYDYDHHHHLYDEEHDLYYNKVGDHGGGTPGVYRPRHFSMAKPVYDVYRGHPPLLDAYVGRSRYPTIRGDLPKEDAYRRSWSPPPPQGRWLAYETTNRHSAPPLRTTTERNEFADIHRHHDQDLLFEKLKPNGTRPKAVSADGGPISVEISPGVCVPLRRTNETMLAISKDYYQDASCFGCSMDIFCIADVSYVICPSCKVISPVNGEFFEGRKVTRYGLGLGFTCVSLVKMQKEILQERTKHHEKEPRPETPKFATEQQHPLCSDPYRKAKR